MIRKTETFKKVRELFRIPNNVTVKWRDPPAPPLAAADAGLCFIFASRSELPLLHRMRTGKRNRHRRPDSPDPNPKSKRDDISINQLT
ncbi:hypothetical protein EVAR_36589_1 [Eumeta japonica]|uniref:Uncharacterized protein n=1 Tax=Eumeta variegata TaxID=151549 RepID=A0A4C1XS08_EUMVA|nr:hypothetical protein EVAR_36589_1 [Eumeta japonica]